MRIQETINCRFAIFIILLALSLPFSYGGCDSSSGDGSDNQIFPPVVFRADKDTAGTIELYAAFNNGTSIIKLSGAMVAGGNVIDFTISPDGTLVAYLADQMIDEQFELFVVAVDGGVPVNISQLFLLNSDVENFKWSPDNTASPISLIRIPMTRLNCMQRSRMEIPM